MTENKRFIMLPFEEGNLIFDESKYDFDNEWYDSRLCLKDKEIVELLNNLHEENVQLKQQIKDLYKFVKYDVDNEIDVYPKSILEHLVDILKIIGDME